MLPFNKCFPRLCQHYHHTIFTPPPVPLSSPLILPLFPPHEKIIQRKKIYKRFYLKCACWLNRKYINWFRICCRYWWQKWGKRTSHTQAHITFKWLLNFNIAHVCCALLRKMCSQSIELLSFQRAGLVWICFAAYCTIWMRCIFCFQFLCATVFNSCCCCCCRCFFPLWKSQRARKH